MVRNPDRWLRLPRSSLAPSRRPSRPIAPGEGSRVQGFIQQERVFARSLYETA